ncbi:DEAD/DEAH box helicase [Flavimarina sp. Hel_I_48]|uniref:DEAD/DEAH box helicase n=1 Tax=Flavimarina sp. Hel_I_48 TaxID=1392488 RepID=UPI0004DF5663|nr:DEAD/DEAH box helicase [Flavimarina sp. Hel_I_48]
MPFKKLHPQLQELLAEQEIDTPTPLQRKAIPVIKSGANVYCTAPAASGKTTTMLLTTLHELNCEAVGEAPRAIVLVENKEKALELYDTFLRYTRHTSLRVYVGYERLHVDIQKSEIFMGIDILISTPKALNKLLLANGMAVSEVKIFSVDDAEFLTKRDVFAAMLSITQRIKKSQYVLYTEEMHPMLKRFKTHFMEFSKTVKV